MASSLLRAVPATFTWDKLRTSVIPATPSRGSDRFGTVRDEWRAEGRRGGSPRLLRGQAQLGALLPCGALVRFHSSPLASYLGLLMKLSTDTCWALGVRSLARGVRS